MKNNLFAFVLLIPVVGYAQSYSIDRYKVSGGGGTSTNNQYSLSGTICQPDAGVTMSGANYSVTGGFWSLITPVQTPGSPLLSIHPAGSAVIVSWPSPSTGFVLQQNSDLSTTNWSNSNFTVSDDGTNKSVTINSPGGKLFLRLNHP